MVRYHTCQSENWRIYSGSGKSQSQWRGGVIRWIKQSADKSLEIGLEILAQELFPCAVYARTDKHSVNYQPAILVQMTQLDRVSTSIIVSGSQMFREKQTIHLRLGQKNSEST